MIKMTLDATVFKETQDSVGVIEISGETLEDVRKLVPVYGCGYSIDLRAHCENSMVVS